MPYSITNIVFPITYSSGSMYVVKVVFNMLATMQILKTKKVMAKSKNEPIAS
jgi:hypothetical protein